MSFCEQTRSLHIIPRICVCSIVRDNVTVVYVQTLTLVDVYMSRLQLKQLHAFVEVNTSFYLPV